MIYKFKNIEYDFSKRTFIMGVLNVTPDSFSDGGKYFNKEEAIQKALLMIEEGADILDIGGESTRPGALEISSEEEIKRTIPIVEELVKKTDIPISIDTYKSDVAEAALKAGAVIVNDISGLTFDKNMATVVAKNNASVVIMHIQGTPKTMQNNPHYKNVSEEVKIFLSNQIKYAKDKGIKQIIVDVGIGFGKSFEHNIELIKNLKSFSKLNYPILIGVSRKSFIGTILNLPVTERLEGTAAAVSLSIANGANIVRVHDVKEIKRVAKVCDAILKYNIHE